MSYFVRVEAVNLASFIFDTQDLSTVRGGSLLLLRAPDAVERRLTELRLEPRRVMKGASLGVFSVDDLGGRSGDGLRDEIEQYLRVKTEYAGLKHATVTVDVFEEPDSDRYPREELMARSRWRQMQSPSLVFPSEGNKRYVCDVDEVRPGLHRNVKGTVSTSVRDRRLFGQEEKHAFYEQETGRPAPFRIANDLEEIAADPGHGYGNLGGKIALIYIDGNKFSDIQRARCGSAERQDGFSEELKEHHRAFLKQLMGWAEHDSDWRNGDVLRLETLLWGGDDIRLVTSAWLGWRVLQEFFTQAREWKFGEALTHSACLIFANHKAPIHQLVRLSERLVEAAKRELPKYGEGEQKDLFTYLVLESFDAIGGDDEQTLKERYPFLEHLKAGKGDPITRPLVLAAQALGDAEELFPNLRGERGFPRRKLHAIVQAMVRGGPDWQGTADRIASEVTGKNDELAKLVVQAKGAFNKDAAWFHLNELWDYAAPLVS